MDSRRRNPGLKTSVSLYVTRIPRDLDENGIRNLFQKYGNVISVRLLPSKTNLYTSIGFVAFATANEAELAIQHVNDRPPLNLSVSVAIVKERRQGQNSHNYQEQVPLPQACNSPNNYGVSRVQRGKGRGATLIQAISSQSTNTRQGLRDTVVHELHRTHLPRMFDEDTYDISNLPSSGNILKVVVDEEGHRTVMPLLETTPVCERPWFKSTSNGFEDELNDCEMNISEDIDYEGYDDEINYEPRRSFGQDERQQGDDISSHPIQPQQQPWDRMNGTASKSEYTARNYRSGYLPEQVSFQANKILEIESNYSEGATPITRNHGTFRTNLGSRHSGVHKVGNNNNDGNNNSDSRFQKPSNGDRQFSEQRYHQSSSSNQGSPIVQSKISTPPDQTARPSGNKQQKSDQVRAIPEPLPKPNRRREKEPDSIPFSELPQRVSCRGMVIHVKNLQAFWVHCENDNAAIKAVMGKLQDIYNSYTACDRKLRRGDFCAVKFREDNMWYRGQIKQTYPDATADVLYIDYGNSENVSANDMYPLEAGLYKHPIQAIKCQLDVVPTLESNTEMATKMFSSLVMNKVVWLKVIRKIEDSTIVQLFTDEHAKPGCEIGETLVSAKLGRLQPRIDPETMPRTAVATEPHPAMILIAPKPGELFLNVTVVVNAPFEFWATMIHSDMNDDVKLVMIKLAEDYKQRIPIENFRCPNGTMVAALSQLDNIWYRAIVLNVTADGNVLVFYVDYGNEETLSLIQPLTKQYTRVTPLAVYCRIDKTPSDLVLQRLRGIINEGATVKAFLQDGASFESGKACRALIKAGSTESPLAPVTTIPWFEIVEKNHPTVMINCLHGNAGYKYSHNSEISLHEEKPLKIEKATETKKCYKLSDLPLNTFPQEVNFKVQVMHFNEDGHVYVQTIADVTALEPLMAALGISTEATAVPKEWSQNPPKKGDLVCAKFEDLWHRAVIVSDASLNQDVKLELIDYGNPHNAKLEDLRVIPLEFLQQPAHVHKVKLSGIPQNSRECAENLTSIMGKFLYRAVDLRVVDGLVNPKLVQILDETGTSIVQDIIFSEANRSDIKNKETNKRFMISDLPIKNFPLEDCFKVQVVSTNQHGFLNIHTVSDSIMLESLMIELHAYAESCSFPEHWSLNPPSKGDLVCTKFEDVYHRAVVVSEARDPLVQLKLIDYGHEHCVELIHLRAISSDFVCQPIFVHEVAFTGVDHTSDGIDRKVALFMEKYIYQPIDLQVVDRTSSPKLVKLTDTAGKSIMTGEQLPELTAEPDPIPEVVIAGEAAKDVTIDPILKGLVAGKYCYEQCESVEFPVGEQIALIITHVEALQVIFCNPADTEVLTQLNDLGIAINTYCQKLPRSNYKPTIGEVCLGLHTDGCWYRAVLIAQNDVNHFEIVFPDYGNNISLESSCLRQMNPDFMTLPMTAQHCRLEGFGDDDEVLSPERLLKLREILPTDTLLNVKVIAKNEFIYTIRICSEHIRQQLEEFFPIAASSDEMVAIAGTSPNETITVAGTSPNETVTVAGTHETSLPMTNGDSAFANDITDSPDVEEDCDLEQKMAQLMAQMEKLKSQLEKKKTTKR